ncbi:hypothetical protein GY45DRAFT_555847 [Cubamyces sp. BRFM 1775]|nr:hypothetical protein GY45DRAFT_555847 [Cubamyces sp. BRFM 1775]
MSTTERKILTAREGAALLAITIALTAFRPPVPLRLILTALALYYCYSLLTGYTTGDGLLQDHGMGLMIGVWGWSGIIVLPWLCNPMKDWRYRGEEFAPGEYPVLKRLYYAACIVCNVRLIGWSSQVGNVPAPVAYQSRLQSLRYRLFQILKCLLYFDFAQSYLRLQPLFPLLGTEKFPGGWRGAVMRFLLYNAWYLSAYSTIKLLYLTVSLIPVATGLFNGNPEDWRPPFGNWSDAYTIRRFWGRTWHQNLRRYFTLAGRAASDALGFKKGSLASTYTRLYTGFIFSGLIHASGDVMVGRQYIGNSMWFFLANAMAITFEDAVLGFARRLGFNGPTKWTRRLGYIWVILWFNLFAAPLNADWMIQLPGALDEDYMSFSLIRTFAPSFVIRMMQATL